MSRLLDLTGQRFGQRVVLTKVPNSGQAMWLVRCACGREDTIPSQRLRMGTGNSCGYCGNKGRKAVDLTGQVFGQWKVVGRSHNRRGSNLLWQVQCACGSLGETTGTLLRTGRTQSCKSCALVNETPEPDLNTPAWCWILGLFQGDGYARLRQGKGGEVMFAAKPLANRQVIHQTLMEIGIQGSIRSGGVAVSSAKLALELLRFKVCGVGREAWVFPEVPKHPLHWLAGLVDADGCVKAKGRSFTIYQKMHPGIEMLEHTLETLGIPYSKRLRESRNQLEIQVNAAGLHRLNGQLPLRYPAKRQRYVEGQAWLDKYLKVAEIAADKLDGDDTEEKPKTVEPNPPTT